MISLITATATALTWYAIVSVEGQVVQMSVPMTEEECIEARDIFREVLRKKATSQGYIGFRNKIINLSDIEVECTE